VLIRWRTKFQLCQVKGKGRENVLFDYSLPGKNYRQRYRCTVERALSEVPRLRDIDRAWNSTILSVAVSKLLCVFSVLVCKSERSNTAVKQTLSKSMELCVETVGLG